MKRPPMPGAGRPSYVVVDADRSKVKTMAGMGLDPLEIALVMGVSAPTVRKYFKNELASGTATALAQVSQSLYQQAMGIRDPDGKMAVKPNVVAAIFWLKCRAGWKEDGDSLGKKEVQAERARKAGKDVFAPGAAPKLVVNNR